MAKKLTLASKFHLTPTTSTKVATPLPSLLSFGKSIGRLAEANRVFWKLLVLIFGRWRFDFGESLFALEFWNRVIIAGLSSNWWIGVFFPIFMSFGFEGFWMRSIQIIIRYLWENKMKWIPLNAIRNLPANPVLSIFLKIQVRSLCLASKLALYLIIS